MSDRAGRAGAPRLDPRRGVLVRADGGPVDCLPTSGGLWGGGRAMTCGPHVTWSCRATQPWVQSSLASGYQLPVALRAAGWHRAQGELIR